MRYQVLCLNFGCYRNVIVELAIKSELRHCPICGGGSINVNETYSYQLPQYFAKVTSREV